MKAIEIKDIKLNSLNDEIITKEMDSQNNLENIFSYNASSHDDNFNVLDNDKNISVISENFVNENCLQEIINMRKNDIHNPKSVI